MAFVLAAALLASSGLTFTSGVASANGPQDGSGDKTTLVDVGKGNAILSGNAVNGRRNHQNHFLTNGWG